MAANVSTQNAQLKTMIEGIARQVAKDEIATALRNLRPGGLVPYACTMVDPFPNPIEAACHLDLPYPGFIDRVAFRATLPFSATIDITKRRPTQTAAAALSIVGATLPTIVNATDFVVFPSLVAPPPVGWTDWVEADSTLYFWIRAYAGAATVITINVWLRATSSVT